MKCPSLSLKKRCLEYFDNLMNEKIFYFLIIDKDTNFLYKVKYKNKKLYFLSESRKKELIDQIKELFPKKNFEFGKYDYITIHLFRGKNEIIIGLEKEFPTYVMWGGSGIYDI